MKDLPVNQDTASSVEPILDELVAGFEVLEQVFIINIVHLYDFVRKVLEKLLVQWELQYRKDMGDAGRFQRFFTAQIEQPTGPSDSRRGKKRECCSSNEPANVEI